MKSSTLHWAGLGIWCATVAVGVVACADGSGRSAEAGRLSTSSSTEASGNNTKTVDVGAATNTAVDRGY